MPPIERGQTWLFQPLPLSTAPNTGSNLSKSKYRGLDEEDCIQDTLISTLGICQPKNPVIQSRMVNVGSMKLNQALPYEALSPMQPSYLHSLIIFCIHCIYLGQCPIHRQLMISGEESEIRKTKIFHQFNNLHTCIVQATSTVTVHLQMAWSKEW